tara:strand:+ start:6777 stop:7385 length:609 start_codon:yes stop_codon:yes gene_type:complete
MTANKYKFCCTDDNNTMMPIEREVKTEGQQPFSIKRVRNVIGLRNKKTGMVCFPSLYSQPYNKGTTNAIDMKECKVVEGIFVGKKMRRESIVLKSSDSDVNMGIKFICDSTRTTKDDWEVVYYSGNHNHEGVSDDGDFHLPYLEGYNGNHPYRSYDVCLYDVKRDILAMLKEERVIESEDWKVTGDTDERKAWSVTNKIEVI